MTSFNTRIFRRLLAAAVAACCIGACTTPPPDKKPLSEPEPPAAIAQPEPIKQVDPVALQEQALAESIALYAEGRYEDAIAALGPMSTAPELPLSSQVRALKFLSFSQCVTAKVRQCRQSFDAALQLDPTFQLTEAEKGHPVWGREFNRARAAARSKRPPSR